MQNSLGIIGYDYVEFYVGSAKMWAYWHAKALSFKLVGYSGPETGVKDRISYYMVKNKIQIVLTSFIKPGNYEVSSFVQRHGDGVKRWALRVNDVKTAFDNALKNGGIPVRMPKKFLNNP